MMTLRLYQRLYFASLFRLNFFYMYRYLFFFTWSFSGKWRS